MSKTVRLEIQDTGNATANMILLFNKFIKYGEEQAGLTSIGISRLVSVFEHSSKVPSNTKGEVK